jgi:hypothetical protein
VIRLTAFEQGIFFLDDSIPAKFRRAAILLDPRKDDASPAAREFND